MFFGMLVAFIVRERLVVYSMRHRSIITTQEFGVSLGVRLEIFLPNVRAVESLVLEFVRAPEIVDCVGAS